MDTTRFLANYTNIITARQIHRIIKENLKDWLHNLVCTTAAGMEEEIKLRKVSFDPIKTSARLDGNSGKVRDIGVECIKQQIYDYVATNGLREQNPVTWNTLPDGKVDVMICLNENTVTETYSGGDPENPEHIEQTVYEYDFNQFREDQKKISEETVRASPGKYLKYIPATEKSTEQLLAEQSEQIEMLKDCLLEMSEQVYA